MTQTSTATATTTTTVTETPTVETPGTYQLVVSALTDGGQQRTSTLDLKVV
jgi:hypothetical protein